MEWQELKIGIALNPSSLKACTLKAALLAVDETDVPTKAVINWKIWIRWRFTPLKLSSVQILGDKTKRILMEPQQFFTK